MWFVFRVLRVSKDGACQTPSADERHVVLDLFLVAGTGGAQSFSTQSMGSYGLVVGTYMVYAGAP